MNRREEEDKKTKRQKNIIQGCETREHGFRESLDAVALEEPLLLCLLMTMTTNMIMTSTLEHVRENA